MIHEIGLELQAQLRARSCPFVVVDRETLNRSAWTNNRIVIEYDPEGRDAFDPPRSQSINPKRHYNWSPACKLTIYAKSTKANATEIEHYRLAHGVIQAVAVGLRKVMADRKCGNFMPSEGRFVVPEAMGAPENYGGTAYEIKFTFPTALCDVTWSATGPGVAADEWTITEGSILSTTKVSLASAPDDDDDHNTVPADAETACGA